MLKDLAPRFEVSARLAACRALLHRAHGEAPPVPRAVVQAAQRICDCEEFDEPEARRVAGLREMYHDDPAILAFIGGPMAAALVPASLTRRLQDLDLAAAAALTTVVGVTLEQTAEKLDLTLAASVDRTKLDDNERRAFDLLPIRRFLKELRAPARAALTRDEEIEAAVAAASAARVADGILAETIDEILQALADAGIFADVEELEQELTRDRRRATSMFQTALLSLIVNRLSAADDDPDNPPPKTAPTGIARDTLNVAGGAASTPEGGVPTERGVPQRANGEPIRGSNLAQGHHVTSRIEEETGARPVRVFRHSGNPHPRDAHLAANGMTEDELAGSVQPGAPNCGCSWVTEWREPV